MNLLPWKRGLYLHAMLIAGVSLLFTGNPDAVKAGAGMCTAYIGFMGYYFRSDEAIRREESA